MCACAHPGRTFVGKLSLIGTGCKSKPTGIAFVKPEHLVLNDSLPILSLITGTRDRQAGMAPATL